ncbi:MAG: AmmeMemoRadiSam system radical SAM enzyme [Clostridiales bacterium]|nr:AmmeMemoRadiSam system radical SAM enzyme [Clostridiales bacterium]
MAVCEVCFRHCDIAEGKTGACKARGCVDGKITALNYGRYTSFALDPIEKKPLSRFYPGSNILSIGSYGCNLFCPFCQNHEISRSDGTGFAETVTPEKLAELAERYKIKGNIGMAFTYNEPLICYEFIKDTAKLVKDKGMKNVLVTNGTAELSVLEEIIPYVDAMNVDIKSFSEKTYRDVLGGDLNMTRAFVERAVKDCHVELTMLIVPGMNDTEDEMREVSSWIAGLSEEIPFHISRFFPRYKMSDGMPTDVAKIYKLADIAREKLKYVYEGNC